MKEPSVKIDWVVAEDEETWQTSQGRTSVERATGPCRGQMLALVMLVAILLLLSGSRLWQQPAAVKASPTELSPDAMREADALTSTAGLSSAGLPGVLLSINPLQHLGGNRVMVREIVSYPQDGRMRAYRETHFYERSASTWQRIAPDPALMGPLQTLQIAHFAILFRAVDADAVYEAAPRLEQLYATLRRDFGLREAEATRLTTLPAATAGFTIEVAADHVQLSTHYGYAQRTIRVASPTLLSTPIELPATTLLYQELVYPLAHAILADAVDQHDMRWILNFGRSSTFADALTLWELWEEGGSPADERVGLMREFYRNGKDPRAAKPLPESYARLCRGYRIRQATPIDFGIPLTCGDADKLAAPTALYTTLLPIWKNWGSQKRERIRYGGVAFAGTLSALTVFEYIDAVYGRAKLPQVVDALGDYTTLDGLLPALFDVSVEEFEAGWQAYLAQQYGLEERGHP